MMNCRLLILLAGLLLNAPTAWAQVQYTTERPRVDDVDDPDVMIRRVELTDKYTIIYMTHQTPAQQRRQLPFRIPMPGGGSMDDAYESTIGFQPSSRLYVNQGERSYKFIRAENIPAETIRRVQPGERVDFVAYFERVDPGYTVFDLFECRDHGTVRCFNFWGVHIINPARRPNAQRPAVPRPPAQPPVASRPTPPRYQPRTTPGLGTPAPKPQPKTTAPPKPDAPATVAAIKGTVRDAKTKQPLAADVTYRLLSGAESSGDGPAESVPSDGATGRYVIAGAPRGVYAVTASAKGYFSLSDTLVTNRVDITRDFDLVPIVTGTKITLKNIYFNVSKYDLKPESYPELDQLATVMQQNPTMQIRLEGHTDTVGDFDANVELSRNRVDEVKRYLVSKGISAGRIETVGYGPSRPINTNRSLKERPENRRVEMVIVKA